jgi:hypothetical protein
VTTGHNASSNTAKMLRTNLTTLDYTFSLISQLDPVGMGWEWWNPKILKTNYEPFAVIF